MTDIYLDSGTYVKSFYTIMYAPSCTKIRPMGSVYRRLHHSINWNNAVPKVIPENCKSNPYLYFNLKIIQAKARVITIC